MNHFLGKLRQDPDDELWRGTRGHTAGGSNLLNVGEGRVRNYPIATSGKSDLSVQTGQHRFPALPARNLNCVSIGLAQPVPQAIIGYADQGNRLLRTRPPKRQFILPASRSMHGLTVRAEAPCV